MDTESKNINHGVYIGGNASDNNIVIGNNNQTHMEKTTLPNPDDVDMKATLEALRSALAQLNSADAVVINNALNDAAHELAKPEPNKNRIGEAMNRALDYAQEADDFVGKVEKLVPHIKSAASWLGQNWHKLLGFVSLAV